jgi:hypothetical protein
MSIITLQINEGERVRKDPSMHLCLWNMTKSLKLNFTTEMTEKNIKKPNKKKQIETKTARVPQPTRKQNACNSA